jgi:hypothetical protein
MKYLMLLVLIACAHRPHPQTAPSWAESVRSGEGALKIQHGEKLYYRRIAGSPEFSRQTSCDLVIHKAQEDLRKDHQHAPYVVEALYYDEHHRDCAVTLSVERGIASVPAPELQLGRKSELSAKKTVSVEEAAELLSLRTETAAAYALTGLTRGEFEQFSQEPVVQLEGESLCESHFRTRTFSVHGLTQVCWLGDHVQGYCTTRTSQCWTRSY